jgi:hypothetical protein
LGRRTIAEAGTGQKARRQIVIIVEIIDPFKTLDGRRQSGRPAQWALQK